MPQTGIFDQNLGITANNTVLWNGKKFLDVIGYDTPELHGAVGDGSHDDTAAIQACANASVFGRKILLGNHKRYLVSDTINITKNGVIFEGMGRFTSSFYFTHPTHDAFYWHVGGGLSYGGMRNLTLEGNAARSGGNGLYFNNIGNWELENLAIVNMYDSLNFLNAYSGMAKNIDIYETIPGLSHNGFYIQDSIGNEFRRTGIVCNGIGFMIQGGVDTLIFNDCGVQKTATALPLEGFFFNNITGGDDPRWIKMLHCFAEVSDAHTNFVVVKGYGIDMTDCQAAWGLGAISIGPNASNINIKGGCYSLGKTYGITLGPAKEVNIEGTIISDNSQGSDGTYDGIVIVNGSTHLRIKGNRIGHSLWNGASPSLGLYQNRGINLIAGAGNDYIVIDGNDVSGNKQADGIDQSSTLGAHCNIQHNVGTAVVV